MGINPEKQEETMSQPEGFLTSGNAMYLIRIALTHTIKGFINKGINTNHRKLIGMRKLLSLFNEMEMENEIIREKKRAYRKKTKQKINRTNKTWNKLLSDIDMEDKWY